MDVTGTPIEVVIGPYEVYTDTLYGTQDRLRGLRHRPGSRGERRARPLQGAASATWSATCRSRTATRISSRPLRFADPVADQVHGGGDNVPGVQTIAFNLPNDERVREAKGAKKVILANVLGAKYDRILAPMAGWSWSPTRRGW